MNTEHYSPLVSVVIPTFNRAPVIRDAIENVFAQTYKNVEIVVVDDGSTDDTGDVLKGYSDQIISIKQQNRGPAAARNRGVESARGEIICFLDSDDLWQPTKLERQVHLLGKASQSVACCLCNAILRSSDGEYTHSFDVAGMQPRYDEGLWLNPAEVLATRFVFFNQAIAIRREAWEMTGGFDENLWLLEDWDLALRLALLGPWVFIREPLAIWNPDSNGSLVKRAEGDPFHLKRTCLQIHQNGLALVPDRQEYRSIRKHLIHKIRSTQRELRALEVGRRHTQWAALASKLLSTLERHRNAVFRRSPLFPKMASQQL